MEDGPPGDGADTSLKETGSLKDYVHEHCSLTRSIRPDLTKAENTPLRLDSHTGEGRLSAAAANAALIHRAVKGRAMSHQPCASSICLSARYIIVD